MTLRLRRGFSDVPCIWAIEFALSFSTIGFLFNTELAAISRVFVKLTRITAVFSLSLLIGVAVSPSCRSELSSSFVFDF